VKKQLKPKKLVLNLEKIRALTEEELKGVAGAYCESQFGDTVCYLQ
jgi:hypothetical protein